MFCCKEFEFFLVNGQTVRERRGRGEEGRRENMFVYVWMHVYAQTKRDISEHVYEHRFE